MRPATATAAQARAQRDAEGCARSEPSELIDHARLFDELAEPASLARLPAHPYVSLLASSFDPESRAAAAGTPGWFANRDFATLTPDVPVTLLDVEGPGVITRIWSATPTGTLRVYIDGAAEPAIEADLRALLSGELAPFTAPFAFLVAGGYNLYFPIAYQSGCRVTVSGDKRRFFYQIDHRRYGAGAPVESFSRSALAAAECSRARAASRLSAVAARAGGPRPRSTSRPGSAATVAGTHAFRLSVASGLRAERRIAAEPGGSAIRRLRIRPGHFDPDTLRRTILTLEFDGQRTVHVPLGDFFGTGPGLSPVDALLVSVDPARGQLEARWVMPYAREVAFALTGTEGLGEALDVDVELVSAPFAWDDRTLHFWAHWRAPSWLQSDPPHDWPLVHVRGRGVYVGTLLKLVNTDASWWGEGDEKIYVDGEAFPSHFGTGTEDYFGYAFCSNTVFSAPLVGQTRADARRNFGAISLYRFHTLDAIPFGSELRFDFEVKHWSKRPVPLAYGGIGFFYARPGARVGPAVAAPERYEIPRVPEAPVDVAPSEYVCGGI